MSKLLYLSYLKDRMEDEDAEGRLRIRRQVESHERAIMRMVPAIDEAEKAVKMQFLFKGPEEGRRQ